MKGHEALSLLLKQPFNSVLDIGSGEGHHAQAFREAGKEVTTISLNPPADFVLDYMAKNFWQQFDCIWACHVLEHQPNPHDFLRKCFCDLADSGIFAVTVPPMKRQIVGGHVNLYNAGILLYQLILAGFDCSKAKVKTYGYNISVLVRKKKADLPSLDMDFGDIQKLSEFFPFKAEHGFDGEIAELNWK